MTVESTYPIIAEGKTKIIRDIPSSNGLEVIIESKNDITAGDGTRRDILEDKAIFSTTTTVNSFRLLNHRGLPTHFIEQVSPTMFRAERAEMVPYELVTREIAFGSFLRRNPTAVEGEHFDLFEFEIFLKDDVNHDPLLVFDFVREKIMRFSAQKPLFEGFISEERMDQAMSLYRLTSQLRLFSINAFRELEAAWADQNVTLVDLKVECGRSPKRGGKLVIADVIDNDSWRIWPFGDKTQMKDKQRYRDLDHPTLAALGSIKEDYAWVATQTAKFVP